MIKPEHQNWLDAAAERVNGWTPVPELTKREEFAEDNTVWELATYTQDGVYRVTDKTWVNGELVHVYYADKPREELEAWILESDVHRAFWHQDWIVLGRSDDFPFWPGPGTAEVLKPAMGALLEGWTLAPEFTLLREGARSLMAQGVYVKGDVYRVVKYGYDGGALVKFSYADKTHDQVTAWVFGPGSDAVETPEYLYAKSVWECGWLHLVVDKLDWKK